MASTTSRLFQLSALSAAIAACGGGSSGSTPASSSSSSTSTGTMSVVVSDASSEDWAAIGVKILSIALVPANGGSNVTLYTAPTPAPTLNLAQLDDIAEVIASDSVPAGSYSGAVITVSANSSDMLLTVAADPEATFTTPAGTTVSAGQIQVQHAQGSGSTLTVPIDITFAAPVAVSGDHPSTVNLEFDLSNPAFLVSETPAGAADAIWAVNYDGCVRHHPLADLTRLVLRHSYGAVTAVSADNSSLTITKEYPTLPVVSPEVPITTSLSLQYLADATNGTIYYDVDAQTQTTIKSFAGISGLSGKQVRIAARYQSDGSLVATRIWASSQFNSVWVSPEGHVLHVDAGDSIVTVADESGRPQNLTVNDNTQFFFSDPQNPAANAAPIGTGTSFLTDKNLVRGFKVHASVVDPLATPLVAQSIDIETAAYDGSISAPTSTGFTYTRNFHTAGDDYVYALDYISSSSPNGSDHDGNAISGYAWWNFAYPTVITSGSAAISDFVAATGGSVNFGGSVGAMTSHGKTFAVWNDPANPTGWSAAATILTPAPVPLGVVTTGLANDVFTMSVTGGSMPASISVGTTSGSATVVYQVNRAGGILTISPVDITTAAGLSTLSSGLTAGALVKTYGIPQADGTLKAYLLMYYTGDMPQ